MIALALMLSEPVDPAKIFVGIHSVIGAGQVPCRFAWDDAHKFASLSWTLGFWSGVNATAGEMRYGGVGSATGPDAIATAVKAECIRKPDQPLVAAVSNVYVTVAKNNG